MNVKDITNHNRNDFNNAVSHPLQAFEWGEFREKTGIKVIRGNNFQLTIHQIPHTPWTIGYLPKGPMPNKKMIKELTEIGKKKKCIFIQLEPNIPKISNFEFRISNLGLVPSTHPLFTRFTFLLDLTKSEEELLKNMHSKTRYNIKIAQKHGVEVKEDNSEEAFRTYLKLTKETTKRQKFYAHDEVYHKNLWATLGCKECGLAKRDPASQEKHKINTNQLTAHLFLANYKKEPLVAWIIFVFKDTLYYPYGASSSKHREVMASNLLMWEAIKWGKKMGLKKFDMWGALSFDPDKNDPWYGFHRFKEGYGTKLVEFLGSYDLVLNSTLYNIYKIMDKARWTILRLKRIF